MHPLAVVELASGLWFYFASWWYMQIACLEVKGRGKKKEIICRPKLLWVILHVYFIAKLSKVLQNLFRGKSSKELLQTLGTKWMKNSELNDNLLEAMTILYWIHRLHHHTVSITRTQMRMKCTFWIVCANYYITHVCYVMLKLVIHIVIWFIKCCSENRERNIYR